MTQESVLSINFEKKKKDINLVRSNPMICLS